MTSSDAAEDAVLSDVDGDDSEPEPIVLRSPSDASSNATSDQQRIHQLLAELERERLGRMAAESAKSDLQTSFTRLKSLAHEALKLRDENARQRDDALRQLSEATRSNDDLSRRLSDLSRSRDASLAEIDSASQMLLSGIDKISSKLPNHKPPSSPLPRSPKYSGLPSVAYGVIRRTNDLVDDLLRQLDSATKSHHDARAQIDHRNYQIAIEVSQLEATVASLKDHAAARDRDVDTLHRALADKDSRIAHLEADLSQLRLVAHESDSKLRDLESKIDSHGNSVVDQLNCMSKAQEQLANILTTLGIDASDRIDLSDSVFLPNELDQNLHASFNGIASICDLLKIANEKVANAMGQRDREIERLDETIRRLVMEKQQISSFLTSALSRKMAIEPSLKTNDVLQIAEKGLRDLGLDVRVSGVFQNGKTAEEADSDAVQQVEEDEVYNLAGALEKIVNASQVEIIELQHTVQELRAESSLLKTHMEAQAKELSQLKHQIKELEEKERVANENVEGLMMDIAAAEEEIARWKLAAEQEAAAGRSVEQEFVSQLTALRQELEEAKQAMVESENKLTFKEETAAAAMAARDAAEKSLKLADLRASRLRERVEELTHQLEESDSREDSGSCVRQRYVCWPWQWLGLNIIGPPAELHQSSNEMELSEPFL